MLLLLLTPVNNIADKEAYEKSPKIKKKIRKRAMNEIDASERDANMGNLALARFRHEIADRAIEKI